MNMYPGGSSASKQDTSTEINWYSIYCLLSAVVTKWVLSARIPLWLPQRNEIIDEIVQETVARTLQRLRRALKGELPPVQSLRFICIRIAHNYFIDLIRHDRRFAYIAYEPSNDCQFRLYVEVKDLIDFSEVATENLHTESLFSLIAAEVVNFPPKLRTALLIDLASRMSFKGEPSALQQAFLQAGIDLEQYAHQAPTDPVARSRQASLASLAYKRISELRCVREYLLSA